MNQIIQGDSLTELIKLDSESVDIAITSPPYNLGNNHHTGNKRHSAYDDNLPEPIYQDTQRQVLTEIYRILKPKGSLLYNHKNRIKDGVQISPYEWIFKTPFIVKQEIIWFNGSQNFDKIRFYPMTERIYWLTKNADTKLYNAINHHDVFTKEEWKTEGTNKAHTRAFPIKLVEDLLLCFPDAKTVLDPYVGSGTTCVAAIRQGRDCIGIELNSEYVEMSKRRIEDDASLFCARG